MVHKQNNERQHAIKCAAVLSLSVYDSQTVVEKLKAAGGGKLTEAQAAELGELLKAKTLQKPSTPVIDLLTAAAVDVQALITGAGENWINRGKSVA